MIKTKEMLVVTVPYPEFFWTCWYMHWDRDFNKAIGEHTVRLTNKGYGSM